MSLSRVKFFTKIYEPFDVGSVSEMTRLQEEMLLDNRMPRLGIILIQNGEI